jgi:hypothetical protein
MKKGIFQTEYAFFNEQKQGIFKQKLIVLCGQKPKKARF